MKRLNIEYTDRARMIEELDWEQNPDDFSTLYKLSLKILAESGVDEKDVFGVLSREEFGALVKEIAHKYDPEKHFVLEVYLLLNLKHAIFIRRNEKNENADPYG